MTTATVTARCIHCTWVSHAEPGPELQHERETHELIHKGATRGAEIADAAAVRGAGVVTPPAQPRATERWQGSSPQHRNGDGGRWTRERTIEALKAFAEEHGRSPKQTELRKPALPSNGTIAKLFGTYTDALKAAGLETNRPGYAPGTRRQTASKVPAAPASPTVRSSGEHDPLGVRKPASRSAPTVAELGAAVDERQAELEHLRDEVGNKESELADAIAALSARLTSLEGPAKS